MRVGVRRLLLGRVVSAEGWGLMKGDSLLIGLIGGSTATGASSSAAATSKAAADTIRMGVSLTGVMGIFAAIFAL